MSSSAKGVHASAAEGAIRPFERVSGESVYVQIFRPSREIAFHVGLKA